MTLTDTLYAAEAGPSTGLFNPTPGAVMSWFPAPIEDRPEVTSPDAGVAVLSPYLSGSDRERCVAAMLDTKHRLLGVSLISVGSIDHTFMSPREVMRDALTANASAIVIGHNHPSGDPDPSKDDELITRRLVKAGEVVGVDVLDHIVFGSRQWVSLARRGLV